MSNNVDALIAAVWRAVAKSLVTTKGQPEIWHSEERAKAIRVAEHVEETLRITAVLFHDDTPAGAGDSRE